MNAKPIIAGIAAGAVLGLASLTAADLATESADAQSGSQFATKAEVNAASTRASAAINMGKSVWNLYGIYGAKPNELIGAKSGPIPQSRGQGGGLPMDALSSDVQAKLSAPRSVGSETVGIGGGATAQATARCAEDESVSGGGYELGDNAVAERSAPTADGKGWEVRAFGLPGGGSVQAIAVCRKS